MALKLREQGVFFLIPICFIRYYYIGETPTVNQSRGEKDDELGYENV